MKSRTRSKIIVGTMLVLTATMFLYFYFTDTRSPASSAAYSSIATSSEASSPSLLTTMLNLLSAAAPAIPEPAAGPAKTESRNLPPFSAVEADGACEVSWAPGDQQQVTVEAPDTYLPYIKTEVTNGTLNIRPVPGATWLSHFKVTLTGSRLDRINLAGAVQFTGNSIKSDSFDANASGSTQVTLSGEMQHLSLELSGSGKITANTTQSDTIDAKATGSTELVLSGNTRQLNIDLAGAGEAKAGDLKAASARVTIAGAGNADVNVTDTLTAAIYGAGLVTYAGQPHTLNKTVLGAGSIQPR